jgi:protein gp37
MAQVKGKKGIEYADARWNPITGCCICDCAVRERLGKCWAERMALRQRSKDEDGNVIGRAGYDPENPFKPSYHGYREVRFGKKTVELINLPLYWTKPRRIATCFMGDISCAEDEWIELLINTISMTSRHRYYILTKYPTRLLKWKWPENVWFGTTINRNKDVYRITALMEIKARSKARTVFISFEPIYEELQMDLFHRIFRSGLLDWIIIGAQTQPTFQPKDVWVECILEIADQYNVPVFMKENLNYEPKRYDFPGG